MKKLISVILILVLTMPVAVIADESNQAKWQERINTCDIEELLDINAVLQSELFRKSSAVNGAKVPSGTYLVGTDIPAGTYRIEFPDMTDLTFGTLMAYHSEDCIDIYYMININYSTEIGKVILEDGMTISISGVTAVFYAYTGIFH